MKNKYKKKSKVECARCHKIVMKRNISHYYLGEFGLDPICENCNKKIWAELGGIEETINFSPLSST